MKKSRNFDGTFARRNSGEFFEGFPVYTDAKGYKIIWTCGRDVKIHIFVWERENGPKPPGTEIHHKDMDKGNYSLGNLEILTRSDHRRVHAGWLKTGGVWSHKPCTGCGEVFPISNFYPRKGFAPSAKCKSCHCACTTKWAVNNPQKRRAISLAHYYRQKEGKNVGDVQETSSS